MKKTILVSLIILGLLIITLSIQIFGIKGSPNSLSQKVFDDKSSLPASGADSVDSGDDAGDILPDGSNPDIISDTGDDGIDDGTVDVSDSDSDTGDSLLSGEDNSSSDGSAYSSVVQTETNSTVVNKNKDKTCVTTPLPKDYPKTASSGKTSSSPSSSGGKFTESLISNLPEVQQGDAAWGDYNNDGKLDILITGSVGCSVLARIYKNNGDDTFTDIQAGLPGVNVSSVAWGDYDNDGYLDFIMTSTGLKN